MIRLTMWKNRSETRTLDEVLSDNAILWLKRRVAARRVEKREYTLWTLAGEMVPFMVPAEDRARPGYHPRIDQDRIRKAMANHLGCSGKKMPWSMDYVDAFCRALGIRIQALFVHEPGLTEDELELLHSMEQHAPWLSWKSGKKRDKDA